MVKRMEKQEKKEIQKLLKKAIKDGKRKIKIKSITHSRGSNQS